MSYGAVFALLSLLCADVNDVVLSGLLVFGVTNFLMLAVNYGEASVVIPIANMSFVVALLLSAGLKMEKITPRKCGVMVLAVISIVMLSQA